MTRRPRKQLTAEDHARIFGQVLVLGRRIADWAREQKDRKAMTAYPVSMQRARGVRGGASRPIPRSSPGVSVAELIRRKTEENERQRRAYAELRKLHDASPFELTDAERHGTV